MMFYRNTDVAMKQLKYEARRGGHDIKNKIFNEKH